MDEIAAIIKGNIIQFIGIVVGFAVGWALLKYRVTQIEIKIKTMDDEITLVKASHLTAIDKLNERQTEVLQRLSELKGSIETMFRLTK